MCFSAKASFIASLGLTVVGTLTLLQVRTRAQRFFAAIPLLFATQQFSEGILWLSLTGIVNPLLQKITTYIFLTFAFLIWPIWIPLSLYLIETKTEKKKLIYYCLLFGIFWSLFLIWCLIAYGANAEILCQHIYYSINTPFFKNKFVGGIVYFIPVVLPFFISSKKLMKLFGIVLFSTALITVLFWYQFYTSVWCFFAAILSLLTYQIIKLDNN